MKVLLLPAISFLLVVPFYAWHKHHMGNQEDFSAMHHQYDMEPLDQPMDSSGTLMSHAFFTQPAREQE